MTPYREDVAVVGGGLMGSGIAHVLAAAGHRVELYDPDPSARAAVPGRIAAMREQLAEATPATSVRVHGSLEAAVARAELVIEAGPERLEVKRAIFAELDRLAPRGATLATNTSAIPIAEIATPVSDRGRVIGTHFWNPPHLVTLVEVIESAASDPELVARTIKLLERAGMHPAHVRADIPGFIGNRLQHALKREAIALVAAGHCDAEAIDDVVKHGFGARLSVLGPLEQSDLIGLRLTLDIHEVLMPSLDRTPRPHPYLVEKVDAGELGAATGRGFREWPEGRAEAVRERVTRKLAQYRREALAEGAPLGSAA